MILRNFRPLIIVIAATVLLPLTQAYAAVSVDDIRREAERFTLGELEQTNLLDGAQEYKIEIGQLDSRIQLPDCSKAVETAFHGQWPSASPLVKVSCPGTSPWSLYVPVTVSIFHTIATAAGAVSRGQVLAPPDVTLQKQDIMASHGRYYRDANEAVGLIARRHLSPGELLGPHNLDQPKAIKRGDGVVISASNGPIAVKMPAVALSDGRIGQQISVKNTSSQRIIRATVTAPGQVAAAM
jgi:flagellar basal body P-ring formation protein FlgA